MTAKVQFHLLTEPEPGLLCRIIGLFAQLGLGAPEMIVAKSEGLMRITASVAPPPGNLANIMASKMAGFLGVFSVDLVKYTPRGQSLSSSEPSAALPLIAASA
jgi:acetolactate synthase small subunit